MDAKDKNAGEKPMRLYLVDASSYAFRAYHATLRQGLATSKGLPTGAAYVFTNMILKLLREERPTHLAVIWDPKGKTFRHEKYELYKANRAETPEDLGVQLGYIQKIVEGFSLPGLTLPGYEADDLIAHITKKAESQGIETVVVSGDKDLFQLVSDKVTMLDTLKDVRYDIEGVKERFGVEPEQVRDMLGLMGDSSDNVPGVPKVGEKTARKLVQEYGSLERVLASADKIKGKVGENLSIYADQARLSMDLVTLHSDLDVEFEWEDFLPGEPDSRALTGLFKELEFNRLLTEFGQQEAKLSARGYRLITDGKELEDFIKKAKQKGRMAVDTETTSLAPMQADLVGISMAVAPGEAAYVPVAHIGIGSQSQLPWEKVREAVAPALQDPGIEKIGQHLKYDFIVLSRAGITMVGMGFDTLIASYLLNPRRRTHNLTDIAFEYLGHRMVSYEDICGKGKSQIPFAHVPVEQAMHYSCEDADVTLRLKEYFSPMLSGLGMEELLYNVEMPLAPVLARMEMTGVKVDADELRRLSKKFSEDMERIKNKVWEAAGEEFNLDSPKQLSNVLFEKMGLPKLKKIKTGYSTGEEVLLKLAAEHEIAGLVLEYRRVSKLKSTYTDALAKLVHPRTGRIHTSYNQTVTSTGRLSSSEPNLQNIPVRSGEGRLIRQAFIGEGENKILSADYSQIELRLMAHFSEEPALIRSFENGEDIHARTAAEVLAAAAGEVTPDQRRRAKVINFGILYGMSAHGLSQQLGIGRTEAQRYIDAYFARYPGVRAYIDEVIKEAREKGCVRTIMDRRLTMPEINSANSIARAAAEREAVNAPLQGSAADIIKVAMISIDRKIMERDMRSRMTMQVHDELVFEAPASEVEELSGLVREEMESAAELRVPLVVDVSSARTWAEAH